MARDVTVTFGDGSSHIYQNAPDDITPGDIQARAEKEFGKSVTALDGGRKTAAPAPAPTAPAETQGATGLSAALPSLMRGGRGLASLPNIGMAMVQHAIGNDAEAEKRMQNAAAYNKETEKLYPAAVGTYENVKGLGTGVTYLVESVGEALPSLLPSLFTGGAATLLGRGLVTAGKAAAEKAILAQVAKGATEAEIKAAAMKAGVEAAQRIALKQQAVGAVAGSAVQNMPDVYQNIYEKTGKQDLGTTLVAGGFNTALDAITPINLMRKASKAGISPQELAAAWYKRLGKGAAEGAVMEGGTEGLQELSSIAAENFVAKNSDFFNKKNFSRVLDATLKGGLGGGAITGVTDVALGKGPEKKAAPETADTTGTQVPPPPPTTETVPAPPAGSQERGQKVTQRAQALERTGIDPEDAIRLAEDDVAAEEQKAQKKGASDVTGTAVPGVEPAVVPGVEPVAEGSTALGEPIGAADRAGVSVAEQPEEVPTTQGIAESQPSAVVSTGPATAEPTVGEGQQPSSLTQEGTITDGNETPEAVQAKTQGQEAPPATDVTAPAAKETPKVDIDAASAATDPAEIEQLMAATDAEFNSLLDKRGRRPKSENPKRKRVDALHELYLALKAKLPVAETPIAEPAPETTPVVEPEVATETPVVEAPAETPAETPAIDREALDPESREEVELLDDLLNNYNSNPDETSARTSAQQIYKTANDAEKPRAARAYAQQLLDNEVDPKDYRVGARVLPASKVGQSKVDAKFAGFTNGVQAASHIMKTGNVFQKFLAKRLRGALGGIKFVVLEKGDPTPASLQKEEAAKWSTAFGAYVPADRTIYVRGESFGDMQGANNTVVLHELLHAATSQKIRLGKIAIRQGVSKTNDVVASTLDLIMIMGNAQQRFNELKAAGKLPAYIANLEKSGVFTDVDEFLAYGMSDEEFQKFLMGTKGFGEDSSAFTKFVHTIAKFFGMGIQQENAMMDLIVASDRLLSAKGSRNMQLQAKLENQGKVLQSSKIEGEEPAKIEDAVRSQKDLDKAVAEAEIKFETSAKAAKAAKSISAIQMMQDPKKVIPAMQALWNRSSTWTRKKILSPLPTSFLADFAGDNVPELKNTYGLMQKMAGMTNQLLRGASELSNEIERAYRAEPELPAKLNKITSVATLAKVDPASIDTMERSPVLDKMWKDLGPEGQRIYARIRDHFGDLSKYLSKLLDDQVNNSKLSALDKANLMKKIRSVFERGGRINPYFALVRDGDFWLSMNANKSKKSADYTFVMAKTAAERDNVAREFAADRLKREAGETDSAWNKRIDAELKTLISDETFAIGNDIRALRKKSYSQGEGNMLSEVFGAIDKTDLGSPEANDSLKDAIYQAFLETMPEQSFRKQFIHRKGVAGFRPDVLQNTAHASARMATQLARIKYSPLLRTSLSAAEDSIKGRVEFEPFVNEMKGRVDAALAPKEQSTAAKIAGLVNKFSFIYYLSGASSAIIQPLSIFQSGLPVLSRYGVLNATKEVGKMLKVWDRVGVHKTNSDGTKSWVMPSMENKKLSPLMRKAYNMAVSRDLFSATQAGSVFEYKATPTDELRSPKRKLVSGTVDALVFGGLMNSAERISREMMYEASVNLQLAKLNKSESSVTNAELTKIVDQAVYDTNEALGNYGEYNRPEFMNSSGGKVLTQFMTYPITITMFLVKNFREMIKPMDQRTRGEAALKFFGALGTTSILAGASGLPMFSTVMGILGAAWDDMRDDLPEDVKSMDFLFWFRTEFLDDQLGGVSIFGKKLSDIVDRGFVNAFTGEDVAGRTGWSNLFSREAKETPTLREGATAFMVDHAGPGVNMLLSAADGFDAASQGDYAKAVKKWAPSGFRNFITAHELATEGAKDGKGNQILHADEFSTGQLIAQAIGFRPDQLANAQYVNFKAQGLQRKIENERNQILNNADREYRNGDVDGYVKALEKRNEFNKRYPSYEITAKNLLDSLEKRAKQRGESWRGFTFDKKNAGLLSNAVVPSRLAADEAKGE